MQMKTNIAVPTKASNERTHHATRRRRAAAREIWTLEHKLGGGIRPSTSQPTRKNGGPDRTRLPIKFDWALSLSVFFYLLKH
jgi:hypothetical protein